MRKPLLTNEHGAWVIFFTPIAAVFFYNRTFGLPELLFLLTAFAWFLVYKPAEMLLTEYLKRGIISSKNQEPLFWLKIYLSAGIILLAALIITSGHYLLLIFGTGIFILFGVSKILHIYGKLQLFRNLLGVFILTSGGILADFFLHGSFTREGAILWALNFFFFAGASLFVEGKIAALKTKGDASGISRLHYAGIVIFLLIPVLMSLVGYISLLPGLAAFMLPAAHVWHEIFTGKRKADFKQTGIALTVYSIIFLMASCHAV